MNNILTSSFCEVVVLHGLLKWDNYLSLCLKEDSLYQLPYILRRLFAVLVVHCDPSNPRALWERFENVMSENYCKSNTNSFEIKIKVLQQLSYLFESMEKNINDYHLVDYTINISEEERLMK